MLSLGEDANPKLKALHDRYPHEPYRLVLSELRARLQEAGKGRVARNAAPPDGAPAAATS